MSREGLTGRRRYRTNWRGKLILQVEYAGCDSFCEGGSIENYPFKRWRDAKVSDLLPIMEGSQ